MFDMVHAYKKLDVREQTIPAGFFAPRSDKSGRRPRDRKQRSSTKPAERHTARVAVENTWRGASAKKRTPMRRGVPEGGCLHCSGAHWLTDCPTATPEEVKRLFEELANRKRHSRHQAKIVNHVMEGC